MFDSKEIEIESIWISQRNLNRIELISQMILDAEELPPIRLSQMPNGDIQVEDGHHRLLAIYLSGEKFLKEHQYVLVPKDSWCARIGKIDILLKVWGCRNKDK